MVDSNLAARQYATHILSLAALLACSLVLTAGVNRIAGAMLNLHGPNHAWIATAAIPSCLVIMLLYAMLGGRQALSWPQLELGLWRRVLFVSGTWLVAWGIGSVVVAVKAGYWVTYAKGLPLILAFLVFGPLGEELLFRGLIFERARHLWPTSAIPAILLSTAAFSLHHVALNAAPDGLALAQVLFTIPMGLVFGWLREKTGSLWPGWLLHVATNLPAVF